MTEVEKVDYVIHVGLTLFGLWFIAAGVIIGLLLFVSYLVSLTRD